MPQPSLIPAEAVFSIGEYLDLVNGLLQPTKVTVRGEVTQVQERGSAVYFTLADSQEKATLSGLIWRDKLWRSGVELTVGQEYACVGSGNVYKPTGRLSFMAESLVPLGEGALQIAFEKLKKQLDQEGYFSPAHKKPLPRYIDHVVVLSSAQGDALRDFRTHLGQFGTKIDFLDVRVEGVQAVDSITKAFAWLNSHPSPAQAVVLTRGGGSLESLQAFNSRQVAEAIYSSKIPVISAVGHEKDITIADLVADVRASTPTDAGKLISRDWTLAKDQVRQTQQAVVWRMESKVRRYQERLAEWMPQWERRWKDVLQDQCVQVEAMRTSVFELFARHIHHQKHLITTHDQYFTAVSPERRLQQGFVWMTGSDGKVIRSISQVQAGSEIQVIMLDGAVAAQVKSTTKKE